jgi:hypothetical protein
MHQFTSDSERTRFGHPGNGMELFEFKGFPRNPTSPEPSGFRLDVLAASPDMNKSNPPKTPRGQVARSLADFPLPPAKGKPCHMPDHRKS